MFIMRFCLNGYYLKGKKIVIVGMEVDEKGFLNIVGMNVDYYKYLYYIMEIF